MTLTVTGFSFRFGDYVAHAHFVPFRFPVFMLSQLGCSDQFSRPLDAVGYLQLSRLLKSRELSRSLRDLFHYKLGIVFVLEDNTSGMGREMRNPVRRYYSYDCDKDISQCCIRGCNKLIKGNHAANLERHVSRLHPFEHLNLMKMKQLMTAGQTSSQILFVPQAASSTQKQASSPQQPPPQPQKLVPPSQVSAPKPIAPKPTVAPVTPLQPLPPPPEVCLRWNSYHSNMQATFPSLLNNEQFVDVTLACEGRSIKCHKMMLSACSAYFEELLSQNPCQHPIVLMKDLKYWEVQALVDFMYRGEVNVAQDKLPSLLAAAEALQIKGLAGPAFASHDEESVQSSVPLSSAEDYLDESTPSPSSARRARKRRVMTSVASPRPQTVQSPQIPMSTPRNASGKRTARPSLSIPSTSNYQHESSSLPSEPPVRRQRKSEAGEIMGEIKIEPIDIEISNDSMDQMDDNFMDKPYEDADVGDGGESSCQGDDPGGTKDQKSSSENSKLNIHRQDLDQMDYGTNGTPGNDQNFRYEDNTSHDGMSIVPDLPGTSYQESIPQPSSSGANSGNITDSLMGHL